LIGPRADGDFTVIMDREITLFALDTLIAQLEEQRRENTYSSIVEERLKAAHRARTAMLEQRQ
jgi:hypothetical protein